MAASAEPRIAQLVGNERKMFVHVTCSSASRDAVLRHGPRDAVDDAVEQYVASDSLMLTCSFVATAKIASRRAPYRARRHPS